MKKKDRKVLRAKLLVAIKKVLKDNKNDLKTKADKAILKAVKKIARKAVAAEKAVIIKAK